MGLFGSISRSLFGGSKNKSSSQSESGNKAYDTVLGLTTPLAERGSNMFNRMADELGSFDALAHQATQLHPAWTLVFAAALGGTLHRAPSSADAQAPLQRMVDAIKAGRHEGLIPFDRQGQAVRLY